MKIYYVFYNNPRVFKAAGAYGKQIKVRFDPWNRSVAYAYINGRWEMLHAPPDIFYKLQNRSHKEVRAFSEEMRRAKSLYGKNFNVRVMEMAEKHASRETLEKIQKQQLRDDEKRAAARRSGRHLSVEDFRGEPIQKEPQPDHNRSGPSGTASNLARLKAFSNLRRRTA